VSLTRSISCVEDALGAKLRGFEARMGASWAGFLPSWDDPLIFT